MLSLVISTAPQAGRHPQGSGRPIRRLAILTVLMGTLLAAGACNPAPETVAGPLRVITDQVGRTVTLPPDIRRISAQHHFGGKIVFALGQQSRCVDQSLYGREAQALARVDAAFAALPQTLLGSGINLEQLVALRPQVVFVYASFDRSEIEQLEQAGVRVVALRGETFQESLEAVRLVGRVLECPERAEAYVRECTALLGMVQERLADIPPERRLKVMFAGPKSIFTVATGEMLQTEILEKAGAVNVATGLKGFWADISPEQIAAWDPDVIFLGSSQATYDIERVLQSGQFSTVAAVRQRRVYLFPSNIDWWDYPAPHCVLGVVWAAQRLYPDRFADVDMTAVADGFYARYLGYAFSTLGGRL